MTQLCCYSVSKLTLSLFVCGQFALTAFLVFVLSDWFVVFFLNKVESRPSVSAMSTQDSKEKKADDGQYYEILSKWMKNRESEEERLRLEEERRRVEAERRSAQDKVFLELMKLAISRGHGHHRSSHSMAPSHHQSHSQRSSHTKLSRSSHTRLSRRHRHSRSFSLSHSPAFTEMSSISKSRHSGGHSSPTPSQKSSDAGSITTTAVPQTIAASSVPNPPPFPAPHSQHAPQV